MKLFLANIVSLVCIIAAITLMWKGVNGWGWLLFVAVIFGHTMGDSKKDKKDDD